MKWITRERPKIDRIACPWLVVHFIDETPEFLYVPGNEVMKIAAATGAIPYDIPDVELGHHGDQCSFDAFIARYRLDDAALNKLALIVRAADCGAPQLAREAAGKGSSRPAGDLAGPVAQFQRRPRDAQIRHGDLRRALCVVRTVTTPSSARHIRRPAMPLP